MVLPGFLMCMLSFMLFSEAQIAEGVAEDDDAHHLYGIADRSGAGSESNIATPHLIISQHMRVAYMGEQVLENESQLSEGFNPKDGGQGDSAEVRQQQLMDVVDVGERPNESQGPSNDLLHLLYQTEAQVNDETCLTVMADRVLGLQSSMLSEIGCWHRRMSNLRLLFPACLVLAWLMWKVKIFWQRRFLPVPENPNSQKSAQQLWQYHRSSASIQKAAKPIMQDCWGDLSPANILPMGTLRSCPAKEQKPAQQPQQCRRSSTPKPRTTKPIMQDGWCDLSQANVLPSGTRRSCHRVSSIKRTEKPRNGKEQTDHLKSNSRRPSIKIVADNHA
eukprot:gnl/MRDRNA2_/MRDRNA2_143318_c0_seq1.p1 gnl/MRDRNA2_/MRDRNA2_143318_c0~~gnl/MRDRNA2_/MRDRNA2_143318_c0_seq1.p1  ORF type:complete len:377 (-),score=40.19 gnl/MRDRNA2_/MRDRNA2_143318_c0_seq1:76-1074(-)